MKFLIPARAGSIRFPKKNHMLMPRMWKSIEKKDLPDVLISTDDKILMLNAPREVQLRKRPERLCLAGATMKDVMLDAAEYLGMDDDEVLVTLYPTYIDRTWHEVLSVLNFQNNLKAQNVLCADPIYDVSVHKCFVQTEQYQGAPAIKHDLYRGQDYPECFEASCFVVVTVVGHIRKLNNLLWSPETKFFPLSTRRADIDTVEDYKKALEGLE